MSDKKENFLELAYSFYPKGVKEDDVDIYCETKEFRNLIHSLKQRDYLDQKWTELLNALQLQFNCMEIGIPDRIVRGYRTAIVLEKPKPHGIIVNVSKLVPYYCIYTRSAKEGIKFSNPQFFSFTGFIPSDHDIIATVIKYIRSYFPGYEHFPPGLPLIQMENVEFDERGILMSDKHRLHYKPLTLFNAFFSSYMFY